MKQSTAKDRLKMYFYYENLIFELKIYPISLTEGLAFIGGFMSLIMTFLSILMTQVNKRQLNKKINKYMHSKMASE